MRNARPHPGPLPQEREKHSPPVIVVIPSDCKRCSGTQLDEAAIASVTHASPNRAASPSLSPGERAGVRASVKTLFPIALLMLALAVAGCGHKEGHGHDHGTEAGHGKDDGHGHGAESPSGASFKEGKGVIVTEETKKLLEVAVVDVAERKLANQIPLTVQVFGERHHHLLNPADHAGCDVHGSAFLPDHAATAVKPGQAVEVLQDRSGSLGGVVLTVQKALALGESEIVVGLSNATAALKPGEFVPARINLPREEAVAAVPQSALLRTAEGTFVYVVNGDAYFRTAVKTGAEADGWVEITDGLLAGDQVVTKPVQTLWLIELRATKGGGHSH